MSPADVEVTENSGRVFHDFHPLDIDMEEDAHEQEAEHEHSQPGAEHEHRQPGAEHIHRQQVS